MKIFKKLQLFIEKIKIMEKKIEIIEIANMEFEQKISDSNIKNKKLQKTVAKLNSERKIVAKLNSERKVVNSEISKIKKCIEEQDIEIINSKLISTKTKNLIITTYPKFASRNVGDAMITESFIRLMKHKYDDFNCVKVFRGVSLDELDLGFIKNIYLPGMSVSPGVYPRDYRLFDDIEKIKKYYFKPISCSFQNVGDGMNAYDIEYSDKDIRFFNYIINSSGHILCRDEQIVRLLSLKGVDSEFFGDLVLFDPEYIRKKKLITSINSIAFSVQHSDRYNRQSIDFLKKVRQLFPSEDIYITFHSEENNVTRAFRKESFHISNLTYVNLSGDSSNLDFYDTIDLHIGYRLHGHISFLRRRKPSVLLAEDVRAFGFFKTELLNHGIFDALSDIDPVSNALEFLKCQVNTEFSDYKHLFYNIDKIYIKTVEKEI